MAIKKVYARDKRTGVADFVNPRLLKSPEYAPFLEEIPYDKDCNCPDPLNPVPSEVTPEVDPEVTPTPEVTPVPDPAPVSKKKVEQ